jgi:hypothetical protein
MVDIVGYPLFTTLLNSDSIPYLILMNVGGGSRSRGA